MSDYITGEIESEKKKLAGDIQMSKLAVSSAQKKMIDELKNGMAKEIEDALCGKIKLEPIIKEKKTIWTRMKDFIHLRKPTK